jgi:FkbM family methyltransferase
MTIKACLRDILLKLHIFHDKLYTSWKVKESGARFRQPLTYPEQLFFLRFRNYLSQSGLVVYDIGASSGNFSGCLAKMTGVASVHAFEPVACLFNKLSQRMLGYPKVTCHNVALGETNQSLNMLVTGAALDSSSLLPMEELHKNEFVGDFAAHEEEVRVVKLDDYVTSHKLPQPNFVKIDVQGYEDRVLRGGADTISKADYCVLEMSFLPLYQGSPLFDDIYRQMQQLGFMLVGIADISRGKSGVLLQVDGIFAKNGQGPGSLSG